MSGILDTSVGRLTDRIIIAIHEQIRCADDTEHHYNRAWEAVYAILSAELDAAVIPETEPPKDSTGLDRLLLNAYGRKCYLAGQVSSCRHHAAKIQGKS